ncbi:hypothetical protein ACKVMT_08985 [Halobacteriales archaeon Cl-PHB]
MGLAAVVGPLSLAEHRGLLAAVDEHRPASLVAAATLTFALAAALVVGRLVVALPAGPLLAGMGIGLGTYRTMFGLVYPVPEARLAETTGR